MKISLNLECEACGTRDAIQLKRTIEEFEGKVYEDYSSITSGVAESRFFEANQSSPDIIYITCKVCGKTHELVT